MIIIMFVAKIFPHVHIFKNSTSIHLEYVFVYFNIYMYITILLGDVHLTP
jgi:hypothetical protein